MKRFFYFTIIILGLSALIGTGTSCKKKDMFDRDVYDTLIKIVSPVDSVDPNHTWSLSATSDLTVTVNAGVGTRKIQIFDENPFSSDLAQIIAEKDAREGDRFDISIPYPTIKSTLFLAAVDSLGNYTIGTFNTSESDISFANILIRQQPLKYPPLPQYYAFCYEQEYPQPGDYDYNDVVMHIALERANPREMYIHVRLAAVGADQQLAGCLRLPEIAYNDIDTVYTVDDQTFNKDISDQYMFVQKSRELLLKGLKGEPVLNLFADAHWATGDILNADFGMFQRKKYNVTKQSDKESQLMVPKEVIFVLRFKSDTRANTMTLNNIDPFIMRLYNGVNMEIHTYPYRHVTALYEYQYTDVDNLPWALQIPYGYFRHPLHGVNIGFRMKDSNAQFLFGAYSKKGNSFGEWSLNHKSCLNWYLPEYSTLNQVFVW